MDFVFLILLEEYYVWSSLKIEATLCTDNNTITQREVGKLSVELADGNLIRVSLISLL